MLKNNTRPTTIMFWGAILILAVALWVSPVAASYALAATLFGLVLIQALVKLVPAIGPAQTPLKEDPDPDFTPFVSIHIACSSEPYWVVERTLQSLSRLDYDHDKYEVLVIHNNSTDENNYKKIEEVCTNLGANFRFFHVDSMEGYKAGALNYVRQFTNPKTEVIAIIDSDYVVEREYLKETVGYFKDPKVGLVQCPQDYLNVSKKNIGLALEYRAFFTIMMNLAQKVGAVTFTGTMGMIRADLFKKTLHWNEWCITEDSEAGIHIISQGYKGVYVDRSYGRGMMPLDFAALRTQRQRWAYGNFQIIAKNFWPVLTSRKLSWKQRLSFLAQLLSWLHFELMVVLAALVVAVISLSYPEAHYAFTWLVLSLWTSLLFSFIYYWVGLRKLVVKDKISRVKAFMSHTGMLFIMSASAIKFLMGIPLGFVVTNKEVAHHKRARLALFQELRLTGLLIIAALMAVLNGWLGSGLVVSTGLFAAIQLASVLYTNGQLRIGEAAEKNAAALTKEIAG
jgi:cellulose synthase/poly-beta-1,6-N-acetylglucosamine synthase-like glycosyltransferase